VEVQVIADHYGTTWAVGVRDCTIQRRHQKVMEEAPSPALTSLQDQALREAAVRLSEAAGYYNAGTVEFLYQPESHRFSFMEMNTRLQVEHPVTERTTGFDLVKLQIRVARGERLEGEPPPTRGHAIEVRLNAEDPENGFAPAPGVIERFRLATGPGVRIDTGVAVGDAIPPEFDSMIAKIITYGQNRKEALSRLQRMLRESVVVIKGGASNKAFLLDMLNRAEVQRADVDIGWLDRLAANGEHCSRRHADVALVQAAIEAYSAELAVEQTQFYASAVRGRPHVRNELGRTVELRYRGQRYSVRICCLGPHQYRVEVDGSRIEALIHPLGKFEYWLTAFGRRFHVVSVVQGLNYRIEVDGVSHSIDRDDGGVVHAPGPSVVVSLAVKAGDTVSVGDTLAVLEAMKMEMAVVAPFSGKVRQVMTIPHVQVDAGTPLMQIEATAEGQTSAANERVVFGESPKASDPGQDHQSRWRQDLEELRHLMLGFDADPAQTEPLFAKWSQLHEAPADSDELIRREDEILKIFVDICSLFRRKPSMHDPAGGEAPSTEAYLFSYSRMLETHGEGLPPAFMDALRRTLAHYGVTSLDRSPELEESLLWIYKSHQWVERQLAPILALLERRLARLDALASHTDESFRSLLDRIIAIARGVFPSVSDLARELRYRCFDQAVFEEARKKIYAEAEANLDYLAADPYAADRSGRVEALIQCPQPLASFFSSRFATADPGLRQLMLEVVTSRYYRGQSLTNFRAMPVNGHCSVTAEYVQDGRRLHVFAAHAEYERFQEAVGAMCSCLAEVPAENDIVIDLHLWNPGSLADPEVTQQEIYSWLNQARFPRPIQRIVVAVSGPGRGQGIAGMQHFTYLPSATTNSYEEERIYRGVHPMMAERLHLWRLKNFKIDRLPSVEDVYLLHAVGNENPKDERLFAVAEVRDLTPVRDETGRIVQLPHLERMFAEAVAGIRLFQSRRAPHERLYWNRIFLYIWPVFDLKPDELNDIAHKLALSTDGLGLEQVVVRARIPHPQTGELRDMVIRISAPGDAGLLMTFRPLSTLQLMKPLTEYNQKVVRMRRRGLIYPYEIIKMLTPARENTRAEFPHGDFQEYDLHPDGHLVPVDRPYGQNKSNIIVGVIRNYSAKYPEGMTRVLLMGDPSRDLGALAESECRRILGALDLAEEMGVPVEWFPISAGAKISMESGVENMDWIARVLRRLVEFTQAGGEVNLVINGINVGAQPYWNAEATMLMHTRGILIMTPKAAMVLT
ncbi:MAG: biotin/lipoyl-containing protein, partial [Candidatus Korobacteraceae bacterium]